MSRNYTTEAKSYKRRMDYLLYKWVSACAAMSKALGKDFHANTTDLADDCRKAKLAYHKAIDGWVEWCRNPEAEQAYRNLPAAKTLRG